MSGALAGALLLVVSSATAAPILITRDFAGGPPPPNDCTGVFGGGNTTCDVGFALRPSAEVSPIVFKAEFEDGVAGDTEVFGFASIDGSEFSVSANPLLSGTWTYTPGPGDPGIRFWVAKGGNEGFKLHWMVDSDTVGATCNGDAYNLACLNLALSVTSGNWSTLGQNLSHLSWYDGGARQVPEPVALVLFGTGLVGVGIAARRRRSR